MSDRYFYYEWEDQIYDTTLKMPMNLKDVVELLNKATDRKILLVEDGSVDVEKLEKNGFYCIVYRQGAKPPILIKE